MHAYEPALVYAPRTLYDNYSFLLNNLTLLAKIIIIIICDGAKV